VEMISLERYKTRVILCNGNIEVDGLCYQYGDNKHSITQNNMLFECGCFGIRENRVRFHIIVQVNVSRADCRNGIKHQGKGSFNLERSCTKPDHMMMSYIQMALP
jgi:hypothetical protein